eukprot:TRINITY_DN91_c1_g2_i1.p1 TRINITY_DN91_c1_g2~~TRINITY_DN91_c1_g2_i1.p1  ORF type:complete len:453 (+),score=157.18 TRINITY_DN91_c1_g2_i1:72-1430(+)
MAVDDMPVAHANDHFRAIMKRFPEAKSELRNMIINIDKGESVVLASVQDLESRLALVKVFTLLRLKAIDRGNGEKAFQKTSSSVQLLRRRFKDILGIDASMLTDAGAGGDEESSSSDSSDSSSSTSDRKKKKKKKKKEKKKSKKSKKDKKDKKKKKKKSKHKKKGKVDSDDASSATADEAAAGMPVAAAPPPAATPGALTGVKKQVLGPAMPPGMAAPVGGDDSSDDDFGPAMSYRQHVGDEEFFKRRGEGVVVAPREQPQQQQQPAVPEKPADPNAPPARDEWMTMPFDLGGPKNPEDAERERIQNWRNRRRGGAGGAPELDSAKAAQARIDACTAPGEEGAAQAAGQKRALEEADEEAQLLEEQRRRRDEEINKRTRSRFEEANAARNKSLMSMHKQAQVESGAQEKLWDHSRDFEQAGRVDTKRLNDVVGNAGLHLKSKFGHGNRHFLS